MKKVYLKNLGCPKNEIDGNILLNLLGEEDIIPTDNPSEADYIIVNSCGFIDAAKEESIDETLSLAKHKKNENVKLILAGCLAQRYKTTIKTDMPEVNLVVGISDLKLAKDKILGLKTSQRNDTTLPDKYKEYPVVQRPAGKPYEYLKISDGCNNFCAYCAIPLIRGRYRSRKMTRIISDAQYLADNGAVELIMVAQDITQYGIDIYKKRNLTKLLQKMEKIEGLKWIRLLYTHPAHYDDSLIDFLADAEKVIPYIDLPLQHISDRLLKAMNRGVDAKQIKLLIDKLRTKIPDLALRTTYILGFPGETDTDFEKLWQFQNEYKIERAGVFAYSREDGTKAEKMKPEVPEDVASSRIDGLMTLLMDQSLERNSGLLEKKIEVLIDEKSKDGYFIARSYDQTPEIDGYVKAEGDFIPGRFYDVRVTAYEAYDLEAVEWKE
jgi:ribosomal protein S12 methylthiotransferase